MYRTHYSTYAAIIVPNQITKPKEREREREKASNKEVHVFLCVCVCVCVCVRAWIDCGPKMDANDVDLEHGKFRFYSTKVKCQLYWGSENKSQQDSPSNLPPPTSSPSISLSEWTEKKNI